MAALMFVSAPAMSIFSNADVAGSTSEHNWSKCNSSTVSFVLDEDVTGEEALAMASEKIAEPNSNIAVVFPLM